MNIFAITVYTLFTWQVQSVESFLPIWPIESYNLVNSISPSCPSPLRGEVPSVFFMV